MPRAIRSTRDGTFANAALPPLGEGIATVRQAVHDGDTVNVAPDGDFAIRFLGVDTAERSFDFPLRAGEPPRENPRFVSLGDADWEAFLSDPFSSDWRSFNPPLDAALRVNLQARTGAGAAGNHDVWARAGERFLEDEIERDRTNRSLALVDFRFFLAFAFEVMDGYGRLLCFLNVSEPDRARRPEDYNLRMLRAGLAVPYFIWPTSIRSCALAVSCKPRAGRDHCARRSLPPDRSGTRARRSGLRTLRGKASSALIIRCGSCRSNCGFWRGGPRRTAGLSTSRQTTTGSTRRTAMSPFQMRRTGCSCRQNMCRSYALKTITLLAGSTAVKLPFAASILRSFISPEPP